MNTLPACPKCKSIDVSNDNTVTMQDAMGLPRRYVCNKCGFSSQFFLEVDADEVPGLADAPAAEDVKSDKVDTSYGKFEINIMWRIIGPMLILGGMVLVLRNSAAGLLLILSGVGMLFVSFKHT